MEKFEEDVESLFIPMKLPAWFASLIVLCLFTIPFTGLFDVNFGQTIISIFSLPFLLVYFYNVFTNRELKIYNNFTVFILFSFLAYITMHITELAELLKHITTYFLALGTALSIYLVFLSFYSFSSEVLKTKTVKGRFLTVFIPTVITCTVCSYLLKIIIEVV